MHEKQLLSFDLSTKCIGYSIFSIYDKKLFKIGYWEYTSSIMLEKAIELEDFINTLLSSHPTIKYFCIEERLKSFAAGGTNAEAMLKVAQLNFLCQFLVKKKNIQVKELHVNTARKLSFPMFHSIARKIKDKKQKEVAFEMVVKELGDHRFPTKTMKSGKRKGNVVFLDEARDMADSYILGKGALQVFNFENL